MEQKRYRDKEWLFQKYVDEKLSTQQIARMLGCSDGTVWQWLKKHNIPTRSKSEALKLYERTPEHQDNLNKAVKLAKDNDPTFRTRMSKIIKKQRQENPETIRKISIKTRKAMADKALRKHLSYKRAQNIVKGVVGGLGKFGEYGEFYSKKNGCTITYKSKLELEAYKRLESLDTVKSYEVEPFIIPYVFNGLEKHYVPDLMIKYVNGSADLVEIKSERDVNTKQVIAKNKAAINYAKQYGMEFKLITNKTIETAL